MLMEYILCSILLFSSALADGVPSKGPYEDYIPCERGWFLFKDKCYKIGGKKRSGAVNFGTASERCKEEGGMLATVNSKEINDFLATFLILDAKNSAWIGLHDQENESVFTWQDGTPYDFNNWEPTEPSGKYSDHDEDCTEMVFGSFKPTGKTGQWNDLSCVFQRKAYICQAPKSKQTRKSPDPRFCPGTEGAWKYQDSCYSLVTHKKSWQDAENHCQEKFQGHLVMISDWTVDFFLDYILSTFNKEIWIGIKLKEQLQQKWSSGWFVAYNDWSKDQGDFVDGTCVLRFKSRLWTTTGCSKKYSFICETTTVRPLVLPPPTKRAQCPDLPEDWRDLGGEYCYYFETTRSVNWYEANFECMTRGGYLVSIHSEVENAVLQPFLKDTHERVFIGLYRLAAHDNVFVWSDGSNLDFTYWDTDTDEPNSEHEKCGELWTSTMKWNDVKCDETKGYICSVRKRYFNFNNTTNITEIKTEAECNTGVPMQAVIGMGSCILLMTILLVVVICCLRPCGRGQAHTSYDSPSIPASERPRYPRLRHVKGESEYYEDMT